MRHIPDLSELGADGETSDAKLRVCVVTSEFLGPIKNGGIATATSALIDQLAADGHEVTILFTLVERNQPVVLQETWAHWEQQFADRGMHVDYIRHQGNYRAWRQKAWLVKEFVGAGEYDLVYFNEHHGSGYYALAAKRAGLSPFAEQLHCIITHGASEWVHNTNDQPVELASDLELMAFERRSVEWADVVIGPSRFLLGQYETYGWTLPAQTVRQPYALIRSLHCPEPELVPVDELVFFGRLETRKGLWLFCDALERMGDELAGRTVTFLGRMTSFSGVSTGALLLARARKWPFRVRLLTDYDQDRALRYLGKEGRLAIMPSLSDNSPCVVYECLENGIPFVTAQGSGADELIDRASWPDVMVEPTPHALAERLSSILKNGARGGRPAFDPAKNLATWSEWHRRVAGQRESLITSGPLSWSGAARSQKTLLIAIIDDGNGPLARLLDCLTINADRFGKLAQIVLLTTREGAIRDFMLETVRRSDGTSAVTILNTPEVDQLRAYVRQADIWFLSDAGTVITTAFFATAINLISSGHAVSTSCVTAVSRTGPEGTQEMEAVDLPSGDALAVAALGRSLGSSTFAFARTAAPDVTSLSFCDEESGTFTPAASLGNALTHMAIRRGQPYLFLPLIGAVGVWPDHALGDAPRQYEEAAQYARRLGVSPSIYAGSAPWFAISAFGTHSAEVSIPGIPNTDLLPPDHPLIDGTVKELPQFVAALGRLGQAIQMGLDAGMSAGDLQQLSAIAQRALRLRPRIDLAAILEESPVTSFGAEEPKPNTDLRARIAALIRGESSTNSATTELIAESTGATAESEAPPPNEIRIYASANLQRQRDRSWQLAPSGDGTGVAVINLVDVPLAGNRRILARIAGPKSEMPIVHMIVTDQATGAEIAEVTASGAGGVQECGIDLKGVYANVAVTLLVSATTTRPAFFKVESMRVD